MSIGIGAGIGIGTHALIMRARTVQAGVAQVWGPEPLPVEAILSDAMAGAKMDMRNGSSAWSAERTSPSV